VGSVGEPGAVNDAVEGVDAVVHLAARADVVDSITNPVASFDANVVQTFEVLEAARVAGVERFVLASSNAVLGAAEPPVDETTLPKPISPYGASKLAGEAYCAAYSVSYGMAACALRFSNVFGPYSLHKKSVVAAWLRASLTGRPLVVHGDGRQTRDYIYVDDLATALCAAMDAPAADVAGEVFQTGTGQETSLNALAQTISRVSGRTPDIIHGPPRTGDVERNASRVGKAERLLGFRASVELDDGLERTARWWERALSDPHLAGIEPQAASGSV